MLKVELTRKQLTDLVQQVSGFPSSDLKVLSYLQKIFPERLEEIIEDKKSALICSNVEFKVVGVTFEGRQELLKKIRVGDKLSIIHQPDNPHDNLAVAVFVDGGEQIGFLPKEQASILYDAIEGLAGKVSAVVGGNESNPTMGLRFIFVRKQDIDSKLNLNISGIMEAIEEHPMEAQQSAQNELNMVLKDTMPATPPKAKRGRKKSEVKEQSELNLFASQEQTKAVLPPVCEKLEKKQEEIEEDIF